MLGPRGHEGWLSGMWMLWCGAWLWDGIVGMSPLLGPGSSWGCLGNKGKRAGQQKPL